MTIRHHTVKFTDQRFIQAGYSDKINQNEYLQLKDFEFGNMSHERWYEQTEEKNIYGVIVSEIDSGKP